MKDSAPRHPTFGSPVLVTGSAGRLGQAAVKALLAAACEVRGFDRTPTQGLAASSGVGDLNDRALLDNVMKGCRSLIHLAATPDDSDAPGWFENELVPSNILGVHTVLEAAAAHGIGRVILASSGQMNWRQQYQGTLPVRAIDPITPRHWYAASKAFLESSGFSFTELHPSTVIAVRLGWCPRRGQAPEIAANPVAQDLYLSPHDAGQFFLKAILTPLKRGFHLLYATSKPLRSPILDIVPATQLLGWEPRDQWPTGSEDVG